MSLLSLAVGITCAVAASAASPLQKRAEDYYVGTRWPSVPFEVPESWAGEMPITTVHGNFTDSLFFWYYHAEEGCGSDKDLVIWVNGGPGCSSLEGALQENGPVVFPWNISGLPDEPYVKLNPYSWHKLASILYVEEPVGTGFSEGTVDINGYADAAEEFFSFLENFYKTFPENKGKKLWITGESDAGQMVPYIANHIYSHDKESKSLGINLKGISINDPVFTGNFFGAEAAMIPFAHAWKDTLGFSDEFLESVTKEADKYGLADYLEKNLVYPPPEGGLKIPEQANFLKFDPSDAINNQAFSENPLLNVYNVNQSVPINDSLGFPPNGDESTHNIINDIPGFKEMIHAPNMAWVECGSNVFNNTPNDPLPDVSVLPGVIEKSERVLIQHGNNDILLLMNGSALAIQNMTWGGSRGFQSEPTDVLRVEGRDAGKYHSEKGLTFIQVWESGHMIPQDQPAVAFKNLEYLLGQISYEEMGQDSVGCKVSATSSAPATSSSKAASSKPLSVAVAPTSSSGKNLSTTSIASSGKLYASSGISPTTRPSGNETISVAQSSATSSTAAKSKRSVDSSVAQVSTHTKVLTSGSGHKTLVTASASNSLSTDSAEATTWTTFCPSPTTFSAAGSTVTVTAPTTLTFTECSCTLTGSGKHSEPSLAPVITTSISTETDSRTIYTTFCPSPTTLSVANSTVVVSSPTTLTLTLPVTAVASNTKNSESEVTPSSIMEPSLSSAPAVANNGAYYTPNWLSHLVLPFILLLI